MSSGTQDRILNAAFNEVAAVGLSGLTLEGVASASGTSRQTLYRHFGSRSGLIEALLVREERLFMERVVRASAGHDGLEDVIESLVVEALAAASEHPLLRTLLRKEPGSLVPLFVLGDGPVLPMAQPVIADVLRQHLQVGDDEVEALADLGARLVISYVLNPGTEPAEVVGRRIAHAMLGSLQRS